MQTDSGRLMFHATGMFSARTQTENKCVQVINCINPYNSTSNSLSFKVVDRHLVIVTQYIYRNLNIHELQEWSYGRESPVLDLW